MKSKYLLIVWKLILKIHINHYFIYIFTLLWKEQTQKKKAKCKRKNFLGLLVKDF